MHGGQDARATSHQLTINVQTTTYSTIEGIYRKRSAQSIVTDIGA